MELPAALKRYGGHQLLGAGGQLWDGWSGHCQFPDARTGTFLPF